MLRQLVLLQMMIKVTATSNAANGITLHDNNVAAGKSLTIDGTALTTSVLTVDASNETDGNITITAGGAGAHIITLGHGADTYNSTSSGVDTVVATAGANTISTGAGADVITSGTGADTINAGAGTDKVKYLSLIHI